MKRHFTILISICIIAMFSERIFAATVSGYGGHVAIPNTKGTATQTVAASDALISVRRTADARAPATAAQVSVNNVISAATTGGIVSLSAGTFNLTGAVQIDGQSDIWLKGQGTSTVLKMTGTSPMTMINVGGIPNIWISDLVIDMDNSAYRVHGIVASRDAHGLKIWNVTIKDGPAVDSRGISLTSPSGVGPTDCVISHVIIDNMEDAGMNLGFMTDSYVGFNQISNCTDGIVEDGGNNKYLWNELSNISGTEITVDATSTVISGYIDDTEIEWGTGAEQVAAADLPVETIAGATYGTVQKWLNVTQSAGWISGGEITPNDPADGDVDVAAGKGCAKTTDSDIGEIVLFDWVASPNLDLTDNTTNKIYVDYNGGSPIVAATTGEINYTTQFKIGEVYQEGNVTHIVQAGSGIINRPYWNYRRALELRKWERASGLTISDPNDVLTFAVTAGVVYSGDNRHELAGGDTADGDTFTYYYRDGTGGWTKVADQVEIDNSQYDDGDGTLGTVQPQQYGIFWVYLDHDNHLSVQYGQDSYKLVEAQQALIPDAPMFLDDFAIVIAKIIVKRDASSFTSRVSLFERFFPPSVPVEHNDLGALDTGDYQHLTASEHTELSQWIDSVTLDNDGSLIIPSAGLLADTIGAYGIGKDFVFLVQDPCDPCAPVPTIEVGRIDNSENRFVFGTEGYEPRSRYGMYIGISPTNPYWLGTTSKGSASANLFRGNKQVVVYDDNPPLTGTNFTGIPNGALVETYLNSDGTVALAGPWNMNNENVTNADINSGTVDATIGGTTPAPGSFTDLTATGTITVKTKGTASLTVAASNAPAAIIAIADYVCDGADDDVQIQAAIDALSGGVGGTVYLSAGTFTVNADIDMKDNVSVIGQGMYATIVKNEDSTLGGDRHIFDFTNADYARLAHVQIHGNSAALNGNKHCGVYVSGTALGSSVEDCLILEFDEAGVYEGQDGVYFDSGTTPEGFKILRCTFLNIGDDGVDSNAAIAMRLEFCNFYNIGDCGLDSDGMVRSFIIGNYFENCDLLGGAGGADSGALELEAASNNNTVSCNIIYQTGDVGDDDEYAIYIEASNNNIVTGNRIIVVVDGHGIYVEGDSDDNVITDNMISGCNDASGTGITVLSGGDRNILFPNHFSNCTANYAIADSESHTIEIVNSDWLPDTDNVINFGSSTREFKDGWFDGTVHADFFAIGLAVVAETELEILDGATVTTTELNYLDGTTPGTAVASKVLAVDASKDIDLDGGDITAAEGTFANVKVADAGYVGSASDTDAIQIEADGDVVLSQDLAVAGTLAMTGYIGIGTAPTTQPIVIKSDQLAIKADRYHNTAGSASAIFLERAKGTIGTPLIVVDGDTLGNISFRGYNDDDGAFDTAGAIKVYLDGNAGATASDMPGKMELMTTPNSSATPVARITINSTGSVFMPEVLDDDIVALSPVDLYIGTGGKLGFTSSSERYKENIRPLNNSEFIYQLEPIKYNHISSGVSGVGLSAEAADRLNANEFIPNLVAYKQIATSSGDPCNPRYTYSNDPNVPVGINRSQLVVPTLAEVQKHEIRIDALEAVVQILQAQNANLTKRIEILELDKH